ncbi:cholecystokinin [Gracilinanus agilis]|uniref:cholecystokinin n=1 Tax=Gracilinanus agilis TaxID=191870 RepID=UPI001CFE0A38|nr:cholecystokinin [Gracilinanus agilis]
MYISLRIFVLLAVLSTSSLGQQPKENSHANLGGPELEQTLAAQHRLARAPASSSQLRVDGNADSRSNFGALLARYIQQARKGSSARMPVIKNLQSIDPNHRINDRDYMGWMDFGRRSAEEYEYSS